jgi:AcrR family transcriptional regulator
LPLAASFTVPRDTARTSSAASAARSLRSDLKQFTRDKIIAAALDAFAQQRIVELAGTTAPTSYRHVAGKSDLAAPLQAFLVAEVVAVVERLDADRPRTVEEVTWVLSYWEMWRRLRWLCAAYWEATSLDPDFAARVMPKTLRIADSLDQLLASIPSEQREKFRLRPAVMLAMLDRIVHHAGQERDPNQSKAMLDEFADVFWLAIYSPSRDASGGT